MRWGRYVAWSVSVSLAVSLAGCGGHKEHSQTSSLAPGEVKIYAPRDGATVPADKPVAVEYEASLSPRGDHLHVTVDGGKPDIVKQLKGTRTVGPLSPGEHTILVTEVTREHTPTGNDASVTVTAK